MKKANALKSLLLVLMICLSLLTLVSCFKLKDAIPDELVEGSGVVIEENRNVSFFNAVRMEGSFILFISRGSSQIIRLEGEDNIIPIIETRVEGNTLVVKSTRSFSTSVGIKLYVSIEEIRRLEITGSAKIIGEEELAADDELHLQIEGSGEIDLALTAWKIFSYIIGSGKIILKGQANQHQVKIDGSGTIEAAELQANSYNIIINGSGSCRVFVTAVLEVVISGSGIVYYTGSPTVINQTINGTGQIIPF